MIAWERTWLVLDCYPACIFNQLTNCFSLISVSSPVLMVGWNNLPSVHSITDWAAPGKGSLSTSKTVGLPWVPARRVLMEREALHRGMCIHSPCPLTSYKGVGIQLDDPITSLCPFYTPSLNQAPTPLILHNGDYVFIHETAGDTLKYYRNPKSVYEEKGLQ